MRDWLKLLTVVILSFSIGLFVRPQSDEQLVSKMLKNREEERQVWEMITLELQKRVENTSLVSESNRP